MSGLARVGLIELAFGALLGWAVLLSFTTPDLIRRIGIVSPRRILQTHLDFIIMGLILIAVALVAPGIPTWLAVVLAAGTIVNPALFVPLMFNERSATAKWFQLLSTLSFIAVSGGLTAVAILA
ncbi:hypothetical protein [Pseudonocardia spinosispora]|uniref:hypothetical protein n=1 Tax=Pseudonocardia spinosispora TaxID=103441 RepID=UPI000421E543|nr:hypothetical protein [Pseudonocardia spinosispora]